MRQRLLELVCGRCYLEKRPWDAVISTQKTRTLRQTQPAKAELGRLLLVASAVLPGGCLSFATEENVSAFCSCPETLCKTEIKSSRIV